MWENGRIPTKKKQRSTPDQGRTRVTVGVAVKCWVQLRLHFTSPPKASNELTFHCTFSILVAGASKGYRNCMELCPHILLEFTSFRNLFGTISPNSASMLQGIRGQSRTSGLCQKWPPKKTHDSSWNLAPQNAKGPWKCLKNSTANSVLIQSYNSRHESTKMPWEVIWIAEMFFDFSCMAVIEMGAETWKMSFRPPPRKRPSGMCGCRCHVWAAKLAQERYGWLWGVGNGLPGNSPKKWAKSKGGVLKCMLGASYAFWVCD